MPQSRCGSLTGLGTSQSTAFVNFAQSFIRRASRPPLVSPLQVAQAMYWYDRGIDR
jgi:hypothetical protein